MVSTKESTGRYFCTSHLLTFHSEHNANSKEWGTLTSQQVVRTEKLAEYDTRNLSALIIGYVKKDSPSKAFCLILSLPIPKCLSQFMQDLLHDCLFLHTVILSF